MGISMTLCSGPYKLFIYLNDVVFGIFEKK